MSVRAIAFDQILRKAIKSSTPSQAEQEVSHRLSSGPPGPTPVPAAVRRRCQVHQEQWGGRPVVRLLPRARAARGTLVFLHGGGFAQPISAGHWQFAARVVRTVGLQVVVPLYALAPQGTARTVVSFTQQLLSDICSEQGAETVSVGGDSAGAGLALASVLSGDLAGRLRQVLLLSPWVDLTMSNPAIAALAPYDVILNPDELSVWARTWAADLPLDDPRVSPMYGDLRGLPPVHIVTGGRDALMPDALRLHRKLQAVGNGGSLLYAPDANHAVGLLGTVVPEGSRAWHRIVHLLHAGQGTAPARPSVADGPSPAGAPQNTDNCDIRSVHQRRTRRRP
jgi:epsilon-lactone hydrolase